MNMIYDSGFLTNSRGMSIFFSAFGQKNSKEAWVFCNPFLEEKVFSQRVYYNLAKTLAGHERLAFRFDYEGDGDSEGGCESVSLNDWVSDAKDAAAYIKNHYEINNICFFGLRLGASVAILAANETECKKLLLWEPIVDGKSYFDECLRFNLTTQLATYRKVIENRKVLYENLKSGKFVNIMGYEVGNHLATSICDMNLFESTEKLNCSVDIIAFSRRLRESLEKILGNNKKVTLNEMTVEKFWQESNIYNPNQIKLFEFSINLITGK